MPRKYPPDAVWASIADYVRRQLFHIVAGDEQGTAFFVQSWIDRRFFIATANHVVKRAVTLDHHLEIRHHASGRMDVVPARDCVLQQDELTDTAVLVVDEGELRATHGALSLFPEDERLAVGRTVAWMGFPSMLDKPTPCFFSGHVSAWTEERGGAYLVDGIALNGVSGAPAFVSNGPGFDLFGIVSHYLPSSVGNGVLPGLAMVRDLSKIHSLLDEAKRVAAEHDQMDRARLRREWPE